MIFSLSSQKLAGTAMYACAVLHIVQCCSRARRLEAIKICSKTTGQLALLGFKYRRQLTAGENKNKQ
tara:strand:- start:327 stop:527 length:201 start_codon:yes stop_codon:yes gene_type:complete